MNIDGTNQRQLTDSAGRNMNADWQPLPVGRIVFSSTRDGFAHIYAMHPDGAHQTRITGTQNGSDYDAVWSPDRTRIAFASDRTGFNEIYMMNADGSNQRNLTNLDPSQDRSPAWSPDGAKLAFSSNRTGNYEIWVMGADGAHPLNVSNTPNSAEGQPAWSPNGQMLAYVSNRTGADEIYVNETPVDLRSQREPASCLVAGQRVDHVPVVSRRQPRNLQDQSRRHTADASDEQRHLRRVARMVA